MNEDINKIYEINISKNYDEMMKESGCYEALRESNGFYLNEISEDISESIEILKAKENYFISKSGNFYYTLLLSYLNMILIACHLYPFYKITN